MNNSIGTIPSPSRPPPFRPFTHIIPMHEEDANLNAEHTPLLGTSSLFTEARRDCRFAILLLRQQSAADLALIGVGISGVATLIAANILSILNSDKSNPTFGVSLILLIAFVCMGVVRDARQTP